LVQRAIDAQAVPGVVNSRGGAAGGGETTFMARAKRAYLDGTDNPRNLETWNDHPFQCTNHLDQVFGELAAMTSGEFTPVQASLNRLLTEGTMTGVSESQLLDRFFSQGDEYAFEAILRRHGPMVLAVCRRVLSDPNDVEEPTKTYRSIRTWAMPVNRPGGMAPGMQSPPSGPQAPPK
jgi:hypothetical protein